MFFFKYIYLYFKNFEKYFFFLKLVERAQLNWLVIVNLLEVYHIGHEPTLYSGSYKDSASYVQPQIILVSQWQFLIRSNITITNVPKNENKLKKTQQN